MADLFYSFGRAHPGAITLHNYPKHLQNLTRDDGEHLDLAAVDIFRDRERGVPRYNQFRRLLHKDPVKSFEELTDNPVWREEIRKVYGNDLEKVDLMTGLYAEPLPPGFGFSETAFRIFVLMASRRLKSDRFFTDDYRAEVYTEFGLNYIKENSMLTVLKRHYPDLAPALRGVDNAFKPWRTSTLQEVPVPRRRRRSRSSLHADDLATAAALRPVPSCGTASASGCASSTKRPGSASAAGSSFSRRNAPASTMG